VLIGTGLLTPPPLTTPEDWQRYSVAAARRRQVPIVLGILAPVLVLGSVLWAAQPTVDPAEPCARLVAQAAEVGQMRDTVEDLDGAIVACPDLTRFAAATSQHPELLGGVPARTWVTNRCQYGPVAVKGSTICSNLTGR
jgi:hypothetical protein